MPQDRSYTSSEQFIFQMCGVESWTELWEKAPEIQPMKALLEEGLISETALRKRMIQERVRSSDNQSAEIRNIAIELGITEHTVRHCVYD